MPDPVPLGHAWRIRRAGPADARRLASARLQAGRPASEADWRTRLTDPAALVLLAERPDGTLAALLEARHAADEGEIIDILVAPGSRRRGIARALLASLREELAARGVVRLYLEVAVDNDAALALYRTEGFAAAARRTAYYARPEGLPVDALVMRCDLGDGQPRPPCRTIQE